MTTITQDIRAALQVKAKAVSGFPTEIAYEGIPYTPIDGTPYAKMTLLPTSRRPRVVSGERFRYDGLFQVSLFYPLGKGTGDIEAQADAIAAAFQQRLVVGSAEALQIEYAERTEVVPVDTGWQMVAITVRWSCQSVR